jgi:hypothetical protein
VLSLIALRAGHGPCAPPQRQSTKHSRRGRLEAQVLWFHGGGSWGVGLQRNVVV